MLKGIRSFGYSITSKVVSKIADSLPLTVLTIIVLLLAISFSGGFLASLLWNVTVVPLFGFPAITWWQAWCLMFLFNLVTSALRASGSSKK